MLCLCIWLLKLARCGVDQCCEEAIAEGYRTQARQMHGSFLLGDAAEDRYCHDCRR